MNILKRNSLDIVRSLLSYLSSRQSIVSPVLHLRLCDIHAAFQSLPIEFFINNALWHFGSLAVTIQICIWTQRLKTGNLLGIIFAVNWLRNNKVNEEFFNLINSGDGADRMPDIIVMKLLVIYTEFCRGMMWFLSCSCYWCLAGWLAEFFG